MPGHRYHDVQTPGKHVEFHSVRRFLAAALLPLTLLGCGGDGDADAAEAEADRPAAREGAVSAATPEAADAGVAILAAGGNAVDAAVAVSFALGVTEPAESGLGGAVTMLIAPPDGPAVVIDGTPTVPAARSGDADPAGYGLVAVPTAVRVLELAWREYGSGLISWEDLLAPAIRLAEEGYPLGRFRHRTLVREYERIHADSAAAALFLRPGGTIPTERATLPNPTLARTLRRLAQEGPAEFYRGRIAQTLVEEAGSGGLTSSDLTGLRAPPLVEPLEGRYRGWEVLTLPSPYRGEALLRGLGLLERAPPDLLPGTPGVERTQWIAEALRFALRPARSDTAASGAGEPGDPEAYLTGRPPILAPDTAPPGQGRRTTHFSVADARGMAVTVGQSLGGPFGAGILSPGLGFFLNRFVAPSGGEGPLPAAGAPTEGVDVLGAVLRHEGGDLVALGSPGGWRGTEAVLQAVSAVVDGNLSLRDAVAMRRVHWVDGPDGAGTLFLEGASWSAAVPELGLGPPRSGSAPRPPSPIPDSAWSDTVSGARGPRGGAATRSLDPRAAGAALRTEAHAFFGDSVAPVLRARGFRLGELETGLTFEGRDPYFGQVQAVGRFVGAWEAAADPRSDGEGRVFSPDDLAGSSSTRAPF